MTVAEVLIQVVFAFESFILAFRGTEIADMQRLLLMSGLVSDVDITTVVSPFAGLNRARVYSVEGAFGVLLQHFRRPEDLLTDAAGIFEFRHDRLPWHPSKWMELRRFR